MKRFLAVCWAAAAVALVPCAAVAGPAPVSHVLLISVDGLHAQDLDVCLAAGTCPQLAALVRTGVRYTQASTPGLSDSFPGLAAALTGGTPKSTGLFFDVSYDRTLYAPNDTACQGTRGWNVAWDETAGLDGWNGGPLVHLDGGGSFNPQAIPHARVDGRCVPVYPHDYIRTNTLFEVVKQQLPGARTAWADKHAWAYDWVNGPSGRGVDDLARTEINSIDPRTRTDYTDTYTHTEVFDDLHVGIVLDEIDGRDSTGRTQPGVPTVFGTNFQTLSVAQKAPVADGGGYLDGHFTPGPQVAAALRFVDGALGRIVAGLEARHLRESTLVVVFAKHGNSPSDPARRIKHGDTLTALLEAQGFLDPQGRFGQNRTTSGQLNDGSGLAGTGMVQTDDVGLVWLRDPSTWPAALAMLRAHRDCGARGLCADGPEASILSGPALAAKFGDPADGRAPDLIVQPNPGVIFTGSHKKDAEHGGNAPDDRQVALVVSLPSLASATVTSPVGLTQIAPTVLKALKLDPDLLRAVRTEGTPVLPGLGF